MAKVRTCLRVGRKPQSGGFLVSAQNNPNPRPLESKPGKAIPTVSFAILLDIPDAMFDRAGEVVAEITVPEEDIVIAAKVQEI